MNTTNTLTLPEGLCTFSRGALVFTRTPIQEEWEQIGRYVHAARGSSLRWMADWRMEGRRQFGDEIVESAEKSLQMEFKDLRAAEALEALEGARSEALSDEHHLALSKSLSDDGLSRARQEWQDTAQRWLRIAEEEGLSPSELKKSIKAGEIVREESTQGGTASAGTTGILTLEAIHMDFLRWVKRAEDDGFPVQWEPRRLAKVKSLLADMAGAHRAASTTLIQLGGEEQ
jgi:hypothetical protein